MSTLAWPQFRRFKTVTQLHARAQELFKDREAMQAKWVEAIIYLRNKSKCGWVGDEKVPEPIKTRQNITLLAGKQA